MFLSHLEWFCTHTLLLSQGIICRSAGVTRTWVFCNDSLRVSSIKKWIFSTGTIAGSIWKVIGETLKWKKQLNATVIYIYIYIYAYIYMSEELLYKTRYALRKKNWLAMSIPRSCFGKKTFKYTLKLSSSICSSSICIFPKAWSMNLVLALQIDFFGLVRIWEKSFSYMSICVCVVYGVWFYLFRLVFLRGLWGLFLLFLLS